MPKYIVLGYSTVKVPFFMAAEADNVDDASLIVKASVKERAGVSDEDVIVVQAIDITGQPLDSNNADN